MDVINDPAPPVWPVGFSLTSGCGHSLKIGQDDVDGGAVTINDDGSASGVCPVCSWAWVLLPPMVD